MTAFQLVQTIYWLALATWFGGVLFIGISAPVIFRTINERNPLLPMVLSVNLENEHGSLLAGEIVGNLLRQLSTVAVFCAGAILLTLVGQWFVMDRGLRHNVVSAILRAAVFVAALGLMLYDRYVLWPKLWKHRQEYIDNADDPDVANPAKEQFDRLHRESVRLLLIESMLLSLMMIFSSAITPEPM